MKLKYLLTVLLVACLSTALVTVPVLSDTLLKTDFQQESFYKIVDYFEYARAWALLNGYSQKPLDNWHANTYVTYVNKMGLQVLYAGLCNISLLNQVYFTIPLQTLLMHYKTENNSRDVLVASSFIMLMGFNDSAKSIYPNSPDKNDTLWASFSFGLNLATAFPNETLPSLNSKSEIYPLTHSDDKLTWKWGMKYTNLTALWTTTYINEENETDTTRPWGLATYEELTFNYTLTIDPVTHKATISQDYAIGRMRNLWTFWGWFLFLPLYNHYNSTGCYRYGAKVSDETIYDFLYKNHVEMSIVEFQTSVMLDRTTYSTSATGQNVTANDVFVGNSSISTYADDGEKIFDTSFGVKETYNLFNYTEDQTESTPHQYNATARTTEVTGYVKNENLFATQRNFTKFLPLILAGMYPQLYQKAKDDIANMSRADYLFLISYPTYSGYRIEHDPVCTAYFAPISTTLPNLGGLILIAAIAGIVIVVTVVILTRKSPKKSVRTSTNQSPPLPP